VGRSQEAALAGFGSEGGLKVLSAPKTSRPDASTAALSTKYAAAPSAERVTHGPGSCRRTQTVTAPASVSHSIAPVLPIRQTPQSCASILKRIDSDQASASASASASGTTEPHDVYCTQPVTRSRPLILAQYQAQCEPSHILDPAKARTQLVRRHEDDTRAPFRTSDRRPCVAVRAAQ